MEDLTCDVCNERDAIGVACGSCGPVSFAYCRECLQAGAEPWGALTSYAGMAGVLPGERYADWFEKVIEANLAFHGKTREEFENDAKAVSDDYDKAMGFS